MTTEHIMMHEISGLVAKLTENNGGDAALARQMIAACLINPIINYADMYKASHSGQLPDNTTFLYSYCEARVGAELKKIVWFGLQPLLTEIAAIRVTQAHIDEAEDFFSKTFANNAIFNRAGWQHIVDNCDGKLPVAIHALKEGTIVPPGTPLFTIESTDKAVPWITNWLETRLMHVWYPCTVASVAFQQRAYLEEALKRECGTLSPTAKLGFVDFGMRGVENIEAAGIGGMAALTCFNASDNTKAIFDFAKAYPSTQSVEFIGQSIPAAEHMTITIRGKEGEEDAFLNMLRKYETGPVSIVSDSYDYLAALAAWCGKLKAAVIDRYDKAHEKEPDKQHCVVIRPDSGDMLSNVLTSLDALWDAYGGTKNTGGFRVLHPAVRIIQGDGIDLETYPALLSAVQDKGYSVTNVVVGSGGGLLQKVNRDTLRFAIKASYAVVNDEPRAFQKETKGKASKRGRLMVYENDGKYETVQDDKGDAERNMMELVYKDGKRLRTETVQDVRARVDAAMEKHVAPLTASPVV